MRTSNKEITGQIEHDESAGSLAWISKPIFRSLSKDRRGKIGLERRQNDQLAASLALTTGSQGLLANFSHNTIAGPTKGGPFAEVRDFLTFFE